jgi:group I intron endonuclease
MITGIYRIRFEGSQKVYVGSATNIIKRKHAHLCMLKKNTHHCNYLQNAYNKYGLDNLCFDIIEQCEIAELQDREQLYIDWYNEYKLLYNSNLNAHSLAGFKWSEEDKALHSERIKKVFSDEEIKKKILQNAISWKRNPANKEAMSQSQKRRFESEEARRINGEKVKQFHAANPGYMMAARAIGCKKVVLVYNNGERSRELYNNTCEAARKCNLPDASIGKCCKDEIHSTGKLLVFVFEEKANDEAYVSDKIKTAIKNARNGVPAQIKKINKQTDEVIEVYSSMTEAANKNNIALGNLSRACKGKIKTLGGYKWQFAEWV